MSRYSTAEHWGESRPAAIGRVSARGEPFRAKIPISEEGAELTEWRIKALVAFRLFCLGTPHKMDVVFCFPHFVPSFFLA